LQVAVPTPPEPPQVGTSQSYALHALRRTAEAQKQLLGVVGQFTATATMRYNLACYANQLGDLPAAREWLAQAFAIDGSATLKQGALADPDLTPLWIEEQRKRS